MLASANSQTEMVVGNAIQVAGFATLRWIAPLLMSACAVAAVSMTAQGGLVFATANLAPSVQRLSPASKVKQIFSLSGIGQMLKSFLPVAAIAAIAVSVMTREWARLLACGHLTASGVARYVLSNAVEIGWKSGLVLLLWSGIDYLLQRGKFERDLRMSRQDLRDEFKETEGNPAVKARIRRLQRQVRRRRMLEQVPRATVVITNPAEFAIALEYRVEMGAPVVVAKGRNFLAQQIKQIARWHNIPMVENPPLAHVLYRTVEIGQSIPPKLYAVVAEILAKIYRARGQARSASTEGGSRA